MKTTGKVIAAVLLTLLIAGSFGYIYVSGVLYDISKGSMGINPYTGDLTPHCKAGNHFDTEQNACVPNSAGTGGAFKGTATFKATTVWAYDDSALAVTNSEIDLYHANMDFIAAWATGTGGNVEMTAADNGLLYLVFKDKTTTVGFFDPELTKLKSGYVASVDRWYDSINGQYYWRLTLDFSSLQGTGDNYPTPTMNLYAWKAQTNAVVFAAKTQPTGMTSADTYTADGTLGTWTAAGYELRLLKLTIDANSTAGGMGAKLYADSVSLKSFSLQGTSGGVTYGYTWGTSEIPTYDNSASMFTIYKAYGDIAGKQVIDASQVNLGMPFIYHKGSSSNWLQWTMELKTTTGALTASLVYYLTITATFTNPAGTTFTEVMTNIVFTG